MSDMKILFYADSMKGPGERLWAVIEKCAPIENIEIFRSIKALSHRLDKPRADIGVALLLTGRREAFWEIFGIDDQLQGIRIIFIVPDHETDTINQAHRIFPRFLTYADGDFEDIGAVLSHMLKNFAPKK